jgi:predicted enzyme related to lactoylglutathione lyase
VDFLVNIDVPDLEKGIAFYRDGIGLVLNRRLFAGTVAEMVGGSSTIYLLAKPADTSASSQAALPRVYRRHWTPVHLDFNVADISSAVARAEMAGATLEGKVQSHSWGLLATLNDPFGHGVCLVQFARGGYDQVA